MLIRLSWSIALASILLISILVSNPITQNFPELAAAEESFDFNVSADPAYQEVLVGKKAVYTINVSLIRGTPQPVKIEVWVCERTPEFGETCRILKESYADEYYSLSWNPTSSNPSFKSALTFVPHLWIKIPVFIKIIGKSGGLTHTTEVSIAVKEKESISTPVALTIKEDKKSYSAGEIITVTGTVPKIIQGENIVIVVANPDRWVYEVVQLIPYTDRTYSHSFRLEGEKAIPGTYVVEAKYASQIVETTFELTSNGAKSTPTADKVFNVKASFKGTNAQINKIEIDPDSASLLVSITTEQTDDEFTITLPREMIDAKIVDSDHSFIILVDGNEVSYTETKTKSERTLTIAVPAGAGEVEIIGTQVGKGTVIVEGIKDAGKTSIDGGKTFQLPETQVGEQTGIIFIVPPQLPDAIVGEHYSYSFCDPAPSSDLLCGGLMEQELNNPLGGVQPFTFQKETLLEIGGNIPFGLTLHPNGVLDGTAKEVDAGKVFKFKVCAIDNTRSFECKQTMLVVEGGASKVGKPPTTGQSTGSAKIIPGEKYKSLTYNVVSKGDQTVTEIGRWGGKTTYSITSQTSFRVTLHDGYSGMYEEDIKAPLSVIVKASSSGIWEYQGKLDPEPCPPISTSFTLEGTVRARLQYYEEIPAEYGAGKAGLSIVKFTSSIPPAKIPKSELCATEEDLIYDGTNHAKNIQNMLWAAGLYQETDAIILEPSGGTKTGHLDKTAEGLLAIQGGTIKETIFSSSATVTVGLISAEKAVEQAEEVEERPRADLPSQTTKASTPSPSLAPSSPTTIPSTSPFKEVSSWTTKDGEQGTICNPQARPDNPCRQLGGQLQEGDIIETRNGNYAVIPLDDGKSKILLGPNQRVVVLKLTSDERVFWFLDTPIQMKANVNAPSGVQTKFLWCEDSGLGENCAKMKLLYWASIMQTELVLEQRVGEPAKLTVLEGVVQVSKESEAKLIPVEKNNQIVLEKGKPLTSSVSPIDPASVDRWWVEAEQLAQAQQAKPPSSGEGCLIATAAFGSELAPQVQMLRETRDNVVMQTKSGAAFMTMFNSIYYSFAPTVAEWENQNPVFKEIVKATITPLISTLSILNYVDIDSEAEMLGYGIGVILLNVGMYFVAPAFVIMKIRRISS